MVVASSLWDSSFYSPMSYLAILRLQIAIGVSQELVNVSSTAISGTRISTRSRRLPAGTTSNKALDESIAAAQRFCTTPMPPGDTTDQTSVMLNSRTAMASESRRTKLA
eukprot:TRINITY_DN18874_c0_g1_i1.p4 TRINITY_DN18874_c0_g1~~TRINITY_DN18874_c0_g1_i1.p4  ORF type:complete len:109 (-),score=9.20 TRINITY_DN18874_c0_g1_i1:99-425(-)